MLSDNEGMFIVNKELQIAIEKHHPMAMIRVTGFMAQLEVYKLKNQAETMTKDGIRYIILNLSGADFIDSAGIGAIVALRAECSKVGGKLLIVEPSRPEVRQSLTSSSLNRLVSCFAEEDAAVTHLREKFGVQGNAPSPSVDMNKIIQMLEGLDRRIAQLEKSVSYMCERMR